MQVQFTAKFSKDLDKVSLKSVKNNIIQLIELFENSKDLNSIPNLKKLKGHKSAFRVRIGDYRLGFFYENDTVLFARILHRIDIYDSFP